jgi:hypothetical protein
MSPTLPRTRPVYTNNRTRIAVGRNARLWARCGQGRMQGYFKRAGCIALRLMVVLLWCDTIQVVPAQTPSHPFEFMEATIPQLQAALATGVGTSRDLVAMYLARIDAYDKRGPALNAISVTNSKALEQADALDAERRAGALRGPLHGIPIIVKDNYETKTCRPRMVHSIWQGGYRQMMPIW